MWKSLQRATRPTTMMTRDGWFGPFSFRSGLVANGVTTTLNASNSNSLPRHQRNAIKISWWEQKLT